MGWRINRCKINWNGTVLGTRGKKNMIYPTWKHQQTARLSSMRKHNLPPQRVRRKIEMRLLLQEERLRGQQEASSNYFLIGYESKCPRFLKLHSCSPLTSIFNRSRPLCDLLGLGLEPRFAVWWPIPDIKARCHERGLFWPPRYVGELIVLSCYIVISAIEFS